MNIFMSGVPFAAEDDDVKIALSKILHRPPFPQKPLLNFDLFLFRSRKPRARGKLGILTLPRESVGDTFLDAYGTDGVQIKGATVRFSQSDKELDKRKVKLLNSTPWRDPELLREEKELRIQDEREFPLDSYAFGRFLADGTFSSELADGPGVAEIACDLERHRLCFTLCEETEYEFDDEITHTATYTRTMIDTIVDSGIAGDPVLFIRAHTFPFFATEKYSCIYERVVDKHRSQGLVPDISMPPGCFSLMCTFADESDKDAFVHAARSRFHLCYTRKQGEIHVRRNPSAYFAACPTHLAFLRNLPFEFAFEVEKAVMNWTISALDARRLMERFKELCTTRGDAAVPMFKRFVSLLEEEGGNRQVKRRRRSKEDNDRATPMTLEDHLRHAVDLYLADQMRPRGRLALLGLPSTDASESYTYLMTLTPTRHILEGPVTDQSNSVLRKFGHNERFLRVSFREENGARLWQDRKMPISDILDRRYRPVLLEGVKVAGRHYQLLGYSMSGLKEHTLWFVTPFRDEKGKILNAQTIRESLGDFSRVSHQPARLGARWSQAFSATEASITLEPEEIVRIDDIVSPTNNVMTDGCSPISTDLARAIWRANRSKTKRHQRGKVPSAFQYRLCGAKGMVVQDPRLSGNVVCLRPSQIKFEAPENRTFDIQSTSLRPKAMFLNRPLIGLLEYLGSNSERIITLQDLSIDEAKSVRRSFLDASKVLQQHGLGASFQVPSLLRNMSVLLSLRMYDKLDLDGGLHNELISNMLHCAETHLLRELKYRAHIAIPGSFTLLGVSDEWDCLQEGEIYATVYDEKTKLRKAIIGTVVITRSPQIHPGDVQLVTAVRREELSHLTNVVVFSCRGDRALASCLGGGDLDGDDFNLILDPELVPKIVCTPGDYESLPIKENRRACGISDVVDFIIDYIKTDLIGKISISHLRFSDYEDPSCDECLALAELASQAVDYQKTGTPVQFKDLPRHPNGKKPDFLAREGADLLSEDYYPSEKLLGQLFRRVPVKDQWEPEGWDKSETPSGRDVIEHALREVGLYKFGLSMAEASAALQEEMDYLLDEYCERLLIIATTHTLSKNKVIHISESELVSGTIMANWSDPRRRKEEVSAMNLQTHELVRAVRAELQGGDPAGHGGEEPNEDDLTEDGECEDEDEDDAYFYRESRHIAETFKRAWAAWCAAEKALKEDPTRYGPQSFGLIALGRMLQSIKAAQRLA